MRRRTGSFCRRAGSSEGRLARVAIALGSNLGDRRGHLDFAANRLRDLLDDCRVSRYYDTAPVGMAGPQPMFVNAAAVGNTLLDARALLAALLLIETDRGRQRPHANASRTLDLDLVLFGDAVIDEPGLAVPHPRFRERRFVLEPLAEIAADLVDPISGETIARLLERAVARKL